MPRRVFVPRPYQHTIEAYLMEKKRCAAWAGMGMGKSAATLSAMDKMFICGYETKPALVCAPLRVAQNTWPDEAAKWEHLSGMEVQPIIGNPSERLAALHNSNASIFTINYENIPWLIEKLDGKFPFGRIIADESTKLKGFRLRQGTDRARSLAKVAHTQATGVVELTGTPSPNGLKDLWGQMWFLDQGQRLGRTYSAFEQRWFGYTRIKDAITHDVSIKPIIMPFAQAEIQNRLRDICLSLHAEDYFPDLKKPIEVPVYVELPPAARTTYREMERKLFTEIEGSPVEAVNAASRTNKCLQIANGAVYLTPDVTDDEAPRSGAWKEVHDVKIQALESIINEAAGANLFVVYNFRSDLERLLRAFPQGRHLDKNPQTIRDWNAGKIPLLFSHPASAGHGLSLQDGGHHIAFFGNSWDLEHYLQVLERLGPVRQLQSGYNRHVYIYYIIARDTVDEDIMARRRSKKSVQDTLLDAMRYGRNYEEAV